MEVMIVGAKDVRIVLVRPRNPLNIGAAARAMKNFGFEDLFLVGPHEPVWQESRAAVQAQDLMKRARAVPHLLDAVKDRTLVLGTSSLSRRTSSSRVMPLDQLSDFFKQRGGRDRVAILFGSEKTGLRNRDLEFCRVVIRIPTRPQCPSMNLGQAVAVCCYEMRRLFDLSEQVGGEEVSYASLEEVFRLTSALEKLMLGRPGRGAKLGGARTAKLQEMLLRWSLSSLDVSLALGVLRDIAWQLQSRSGRGSTAK